MKSCRILAIEIRRQKIGYVVLDRERSVLDWGVRWFRALEELDRTLRRISGRFEPTQIVFSFVKRTHSRHRHTEKQVHLIHRHARNLGIPAVGISKHVLRIHFAKIGRFNKFDISQLIVDQFPSLAWQMPQKRKAWQSESNRQVIFDAASLALHHITLSAIRRRILSSAPNDE